MLLLNYGCSMCWEKRREPRAETIDRQTQRPSKQALLNIDCDRRIPTPNYLQELVAVRSVVLLRLVLVVDGSDRLGVGHSRRTVSKYAKRKFNTVQSRTGRNVDTYHTTRRQALGTRYYRTEPNRILGSSIPRKVGIDWLFQKIGTDEVRLRLIRFGFSSEPN